MKNRSDNGSAGKQKAGYTPAQWLIELTGQIRVCESDIKNTIKAGQTALAAQLRAYDLLDAIARYSPLDTQMKVLAEQIDNGSREEIFHNFFAAVEALCKIADAHAEELEDAFRRSDLHNAAASYLRPWSAQYNKMEERAHQAMLLYNAADHAYKCQLNGSLIEKWRSLRSVRRMAGFRLERKRTGNYVTKTYELMLEAQKELMAAQQQMYSHNVGYKCEQMLYVKIARALEEIGASNSMV